MTATSPVTFALGMASSNGSPPSVVLFFDDGATVALHSVRGLAVEMGLRLHQQTVFDLLQDWDRSIVALTELVQALAYSDRARGHRGHFVTEDVWTSERLAPEARQIFRLLESGAEVLPVTVQGAASAILVLNAATRRARPNLCLAAVLGRACRHADEVAACSAIAGWTLATELVQTERAGLGRLSAPASLILGPLLVPSAFAGDLSGIPYVLALMGRPVIRGTLDTLARPVAAGISSLSQDALLLPGDVVVAGPGPPPDMLEAESTDVIEAFASGFGRQKVSLR